MTVSTAVNNEVAIAYETFGDPGGRPLLLLNGIDLQMVWLPDDLCELLAELGFHVARFDYRDSGLSVRVAPGGADAPGGAPVQVPPEGPYRGEELIADVLAVLDTLGWSSAHLLGMSLGAGIAQHLALRHPARVRSLALVGGLRMPIGAVANLRHLRARFLLGTPARRYGPDRGEQERRLVDVYRLACSSAHPLEEEWARATAALAYERRPPSAAVPRRQLAAVRELTVPAGGLAGITAPTLVVHGEADPLIRPSAARVLSRAIPGSRLMLLPGMGHVLPRPLWPVVGEAIDRQSGPA
ncbi:alpha/beta fold hydrolase [Streptomyces otsuchiensis]|uniref:alpha/beta fold hydrolase n=1 Tax=Streptomyces otsuchiensis TaxID=2681388 RepID=UPI00103058C5|nr:alpha/beta hydrolase [Streptomyces otsuchiensis]